MECPKCKENNEDLEKTFKNSPDWVVEAAYKLEKYNEHNVMYKFIYNDLEYHFCGHCKRVYDENINLTKITIL
jgi:hypothetical protein